MRLFVLPSLSSGQGKARHMKTQHDRCRDCRGCISGTGRWARRRQEAYARRPTKACDARGTVSVTERAAYIGRVRALARKVAQAYFNAREALGFPLVARAAQPAHAAQGESGEPETSGAQAAPDGSGATASRGAPQGAAIEQPVTQR